MNQVERRELFATTGTHHLTTLTLVPKAQLEVCQGVLHELGVVEEVRCGGATVVHRQGGGVVGGHPLTPMTPLLVAVDVGGRGQTSVDGLVLNLAPFSLLLFVTRASH